MSGVFHWWVRATHIQFRSADLMMENMHSKSSGGRCLHMDDLNIFPTEFYIGGL